MNIIRAFIAGMVLPSILLPLFMYGAWSLGKVQMLCIPFLHLIPLIWGLWNVLYFAIFRQSLPGHLNLRLLLTGGLLGLIIATEGIIRPDIPALIGLTGNARYIPLFVAPIIYAILWRYFVKHLNVLLGLKEEHQS